MPLPRDLYEGVLTGSDLAIAELRIFLAIAEGAGVSLQNPSRSMLRSNASEDRDRMVSVVASATFVITMLLALTATAAVNIGPLRVAQGSYIGDGRPVRLVKDVGFPPEILIVRGEDNRSALLKTDTMGDPFSKPLGGAVALVSDGVLTLSSAGFTVSGVGVRANNAGVVYHWIAFAGGVGEVAHGSYTGNGMDNRDIVGLGLDPAYVWVIPRGAQDPQHRFFDEAVNESQLFGASGAKVDRIQDFVVDGFQVGRHASVNGIGSSYDWIAWGAASPSIRQFSYVGDGSVGRRVSGLGLQPAFVLIESDDASGVAVMRLESQKGFTSLPVESSPPVIDGIAALMVDGFVAFGGGNSNRNGTLYHGVAFQTTEVLDLAIGNTVDSPTPLEGQTVRFSVNVSNPGPLGATGVAVRDSLPAGLSFVSALPSVGSYDPGNGLWVVGIIDPFNEAILEIAATVDVGTSGQLLLNRAELFAVDQADTLQSNNSAQAVVAVGAAPQLVDVAVGVTLDTPFPAEGDTIRIWVDTNNAGPSLATGVEARVALPNELSFVDAIATQGLYTNGSSRWFIGTLGAGAVAQLEIRAVVRAGTAGRRASVDAAVVAVDQSDTGPGNNSAFAEFNVIWADVEVTAHVDNARPLEGGIVHLVLMARNLAPFDAIGVVIQDSLPAQLNYAGHLVSRGSYDPISGNWSVGLLPAGSVDSLQVTVSVAAAGMLAPFQNEARLVAVIPDDVSPTNDVAVSVLQMAQVDLTLAKVADRNQSLEAEAVNFTVSVLNSGPDVATGIVVEDILPATMSYVGSTASRGSYSPIAGTWTGLDLGVGGVATLVLTAKVALGTAGQILTNSAQIVGRDQLERNPTDDSDAAQVQIVAAAVASIQVSAPTQTGGALLPADTPVLVFELELLNGGPVEEVLSGVTFTGLTFGPGTQAELDGDWAGLRLDAGNDVVALPLIAPEFVDGRLAFDGLNLRLRIGKTVILRLWGGASLVARDGDVLDLSVNASTDLRFVGMPSLSGTFPLSPFGEFTVDGMSAAQIVTTDLPSTSFLAGTTENVAMAFVVPPNGYSADELQKVNVINLGDARPGTDLGAVEAWVDDGDLSFSAGSDALLGGFVFTGARWELTGMNVPVATGGRLVFVTVDVAELAIPGRTVRLALPAGQDAALGMASGNDGPMDRSVASAAVHPITAPDRVSLAALPIDPGVVSPGDDNVEGLRINLTNNYTIDQTLSSIRVSNATLGVGTQIERDGEIAVVSLRDDGDGDGVLTTIDVDPVLGTSFFLNGRAEFGGLNWIIPADASRVIFVILRVSDQQAADGDQLAVNLVDPGDIGFKGDVAVAASWPLDSGARWLVDGMLAAQVTHQEVPSVALGPGEGPALALDIIVPSNGYQSDSFQGLTIENLGTAVDGDIAELRLWRDGGDGSFDAGGGDDMDLGAMVALGGRWQSVLLGEVVNPPGVRFYVGVTVSAVPTDSATVRLQVPIGGIAMNSADDGPLDTPIANVSSVLLSQAPLLARIEVSPPVTTIGDLVTVRMIVRNVSGETVTGISPGMVSLVGDPVLSPVAGPAPMSIDLGMAARDTFVWTYSADASGETRLEGDASGLGSPSGIIRMALKATSNSVRVFTQADSLGVSPVVSAPFSVNRGQANVVPMSLTFDNPAGAGGSDILLTGLRLRIENSQGAGIVPAGLLSRVVVNEGTQVYLDKSSIESTGFEVDLTLASPARVIPQEPATLNLQLDLLATTVVPDFRVVMTQGTWLVAEDANSGAPIVSYLENGSFPVSSGLATVLAEAESLAVTRVLRPSLSANAGQGDLNLGAVSLVNVGVTGLTSDVRVGQLQWSLYDSSMNRVAQPGAVVSRVRVSSLVQTYADLPIASDADSVLVVDLSPPVSMAANSPLTVDFSVDLRADAPFGRYLLRLEDPNTLDATDAITRNAVAVSYDPVPMNGPWLEVQSAATELRVAASGALPATTTGGASDLLAIRGVFRHPGAPSVSRLRVDSLSVRALDETRQPIGLGGLLSGLRVLWGDSVVTDVGVLVSTGSRLSLALGGLYLSAGDSISVAVRIDIDSAAPTESFELLIDDFDIVARDANSGMSVEVLPAAGFTLPISSGLARLVPQATQLVVDFDGLAPSTLAAGQVNVALANLQLINPGLAGSADVRVVSLTVRSADESDQSVAVGSALSGLALYDGATVVATASGLNADSTAVTLVFGEIAVPADAPRNLVLRGDIALRQQVQGLRMGVAADGVGVRSPAVVVSPVAGKVFPLWTEASSFSAAELAASYANFPNPFRAGQEETTFAYYLDADARVSLRVFMLTGEPVVTLLESSAKTLGMHQEDRWDGRSGSGVTLRNGVYLARIQVEYDDGRRESLLRRVAVIR